MLRLQDLRAIPIWLYKATLFPNDIGQRPNREWHMKTSLEANKVADSPLKMIYQRACHSKNFKMESCPTCASPPAYTQCQVMSPSYSVSHFKSG